MKRRPKSALKGATQGQRTLAATLTRLAPIALFAARNGRLLLTLGAAIGVVTAQQTGRLGPIVDAISALVANG